MDLTTVMNKLYESEINCSIASHWDAGWEVKLGDENNGFAAETWVRTLEEAAAFLDSAAREHFAESVYVLGAEEHFRRDRERVARQPRYK